MSTKNSIDCHTNYRYASGSLTFQCQKTFWSLSTIFCLQWVREFHTWWAPFRVAILHETGSFQGPRDQLIRAIGRSSGIIITSYSSILTYKEELTKQDFDYVILDEVSRNVIIKIFSKVIQPVKYRATRSATPMLKLR